jgi:hypothetical protein
MSKLIVPPRQACGTARQSDSRILHSALGYRSPIAYEAAMERATNQPAARDPGLGEQTQRVVHA